MNKRLKIIFTTSLSLNILLTGFILGYLASPKMKPMMKHHKPKHHNFHDREEKIVNSLPEAKQQEALGVLKQMREIRENSFDASKEIFEEIEKIATAESFNETHFLQTFSKFHDSMTSTKKESDVIIAKFLATLTQDERKKLVGDVKSLHHKQMSSDFRDRPDRKGEHHAPRK